MERAIYDRMAEGQAGHWWFVARRRILSAVIGDLDLPSGARILEAGCGPGGNLGMLAAFGSISAFEPDEGARRYVASLGFDAADGRLPGPIPFPPGSFDLVVALDVIEHLDDDVGSIRALGAMLSPRGRCLFTVPAYPFLWSRHDEMHHHKRRYTRRRFVEAATAAGLSVSRVSFFNTVLFPPIAAVRVARNVLGVKDSDDDRVPAPAVNALLGALFASEHRALRHFDLPFGLSLMMVAERQ